MPHGPAALDQFIGASPSLGSQPDPPSLDETPATPDNRAMSVSEQAGYPESVLCRFLDARLPQRHAVAQDWARRAENAPWSAIETLAQNRQQLGAAIEIRIGLDLAKTPGYWDVLSFLPPVECRVLLSGAGYSSDMHDHFADTGTTDPLLREWTRTFHPVTCGDDQRPILAACWDAAGMRDLAHVMRASTQIRRSILVHQRDDLGAVRHQETAIDCLAHLWQGYVQHGRRHLMSLGSRVILEPELGFGFGKADLVVGRCLVDIKAVLDPSRWFERWLNQVLGYVLLDWSDTLILDSVAIYLAWQGLLLSEPLAGLLTTSTIGPTPSLADLRADFRAQIQADVDSAFSARMREHYRSVIPAAASSV